MLTAGFWIKKLNLTPHPEGGYYREIYRSDDIIMRTGLPSRYQGDRSAATLIYYLLKDDDVSAFHRIRSDEIWVYVAGESLDIHQIAQDGIYYKKRLGMSGDKDSSPVHVIRHDTWFGASLPAFGSFCLCTCFVAPGFDFSDFELADPEILKRTYPGLSAMIDKLSR